MGGQPKKAELAITASPCIDATVAIKGAPLSSVRIDGDDEHLLFRPSLHEKLLRDDFPSG